MLRSVAAIVIGFVVMAICVMISTAMAAKRMLGSSPGAQTPGKLTSSYIAVNLILSGLSAVLGGFVAGRLASYSPIGHALGLAVLVGLMTVPMFRDRSGAQPSSYKVGLLILGTLGALAGGVLASFIG